MLSKRELTVLAHCVALQYAKKRKMRKDLCGLCMLSSFALYEGMRANDRDFGTAYNPRLVLGMTEDALHCWVESDQDVYDPTYLQFGDGGKPLHIGEQTVWHGVFKKQITADWETFKWVDKRQKPTRQKVNNFLREMWKCI